MREQPLDHVPDLILEQYRLNELPPEEIERIERLVRTDAAVRERLVALETSDSEIAARYPAGLLSRRVRESMTARGHVDGPRAYRHRLVLIASTITTAAIVLAFAVPRMSSPDADGDRIKGLTPSIAVYRRTPQGTETLGDGAPARAGDLLRLGYVSAGRGYGLILSIDGRGVVTLHLPPNGTRAATLRGGGRVLLDAAYELDDAPAWERFYFVTADQSFEVAPILEAARRVAAGDRRTPPGPLPIPRELGQFLFSIQKEVRP